MDETCERAKAKSADSGAGAAAKGGGAPADVKSELDRVTDMATLGCTVEEIAENLGCRPKALERRFGKVIRQARAEGARKLRETQWSKAIADGNVPMLIWLGRQRLGQSQQPDAPEEEGAPARVVLDLSQNP